MKFALCRPCAARRANEHRRAAFFIGTRRLLNDDVSFGAGHHQNKTDFHFALIFVESKTRFNISASNPQPLVCHGVSTASGGSTHSTGCWGRTDRLARPLLRRHLAGLAAGADDVVGAQGAVAGHEVGLHLACDGVDRDRSNYLAIQALALSAVGTGGQPA